MVIYNFIFFIFYKFSKKIGGDRTSNEANAWLNLTILINFNLQSVIYLTEQYYHKEIINRTFNFIVGLLVGLLVYLKSIYKNKFKSDIIKFESMPKSKKIGGLVVLVIYIIVSIVMFFHLYNYHRAIMGLS